MTRLVSIWASRRVDGAVRCAAALEAELRTAGLEAVVHLADALHGLDELRKSAADEERAGAGLFVAVDSPPGFLAAILYAAGTRPVIFLPVAGEVWTGAACEAPVATVASGKSEDAVMLAVRILGAAGSGTGPAEVRAQGAKSDAGLVPEPRVRTMNWSEEDEEWFERIAADFRPRMPARQAPVNYKPRPALDYSPALRQAISGARGVAAARGGKPTGPEHFLLAILEEGGTAVAGELSALGVRTDIIVEKLRGRIGPETSTPTGEEVFVLNGPAEEMLTAAKQHARDEGRPLLTAADVAYVCLGGEAIAGLETGVADDVLRTALLDAAAGREVEAAQAPLKPAGRIVHAPSTEIAAHIPRGSLKQEGGAGRPHEPPTEEVTAHEQPAPAPRKPSVVECDPTNPSVDTIEAMADLLLEGHLVALPTDTAFVVAADATNAGAVRRLREAAGRGQRAPVSVMVHSTSVLKQLVSGWQDDLELVIDGLWPGPVTLVFPRRPRALSGVAESPTIGVRIPDNYATLAVLSMVGRPLAVATMDGHGSAGGIITTLGEAIAAVLDEGRERVHEPTTVVSMEMQPYRLVREGAMSRDRIATALGDLLAE